MKDSRQPGGEERGPKHTLLLFFPSANDGIPLETSFGLVAEDEVLVGHGWLQIR